MKRYELMNCNHKAIVHEYDDGSAELFSYGKKVATFAWGQMNRMPEQPQSNTTARHMREFAALFGLPRMTKAQLLKLPIA